MWCLVTQNALRSDEDFPLRSLESLISDHDKFIEAGGNPKNVKNFNNALRKPLFNIPLSQVSILLSQVTYIVIMKLHVYTVGVYTWATCLTGFVLSHLHTTGGRVPYIRYGINNTQLQQH